MISFRVVWELFRKIYLYLSVALFAFAMTAPAAVAQEEAAEQEQEEEEIVEVAEVEEAAAPSEGADDVIEEIIITGSRIRRDAFSSAAPVQIISGQGSREIGLIDTAALLQSASQATGTQIDNTFSGFVLDNGPGSSQANLRNLGPERVLLLMNSRRLAPGGVGGAPTSPDLSLIPSIMIDRIEFLLDGASSIYGSDAVAGVINVIMRTDFEGFEFEGFTVQPDSQAGEENNYGLIWGKSGDNWNLGIAAEYYNRERIRLSDRDFTERCNRYIYEDTNGRILNDRLDLVPGTTISPCKLSTINRVFIPTGYGNVWSTPGATNIGIPNFSETEVGVGLAGFNPTIIPIDTDGDGEPDTGLIDPDGNGRTEVDLQTEQYNFNGSRRDRSGDLLSGTQRYNVYAYGDYDFGNESNTSVYFEFLYNNRQTEVFGPGATIFPDVLPTNPYNICNQDQPNGVNCLGFFGVNFGNLETTPIISVLGDRELNDVEIEQFRYVVGVRGDIPWLQADFGLGDWGYDLYVSHSTSEGDDSLGGILDAELEHSLATSAIDPNTGEIVCGDDANGDGIPDGNGCVPVNLFAGSLYQPGGGRFATQAETDYLFALRDFKTEVDQTIVSAVVQGDIWKLPWNDTSVPLVLGAEYRKDDINSIPNDVAGEGLLFGFFSDGGAVGDRDLKEFFLETELQLLQGVKGAEELSLNLATRYTRESTYGSDTTYSAKMLYTPVDGITLRGTYGTSFRAPNAREQFLVGQSGFNNIFDPCVVPEEARIPALNPNEDATYDPSNDDRSQILLDNCRANNVDPTMLGLDGTVTTYSVEILQRGGQQVQLNIDPETSISYTYGIVLDQQFWDTFDLRVSATLFDIEVEDSIALLSAQFLVNDCYSENDLGASLFCRFLTRDQEGLLDLIDSSFININTEIYRGIDYNLYFQKDLIVADRNLDLEVDLIMTRNLASTFIFEDSRSELAGTTRVPEWEGIVTFTATYDDLRFRWRASYIDGGQEATEDFDATEPPCFGLSAPCRPLAETDDYWTHTASITWQPKNWSFTLGVANLFDESPPLIDTLAPGTQANNIPLGAGYDVQGRRIFFTVRRGTGGGVRVGQYR